QLRAVVDLLDASPFLPAELLGLCRWPARYYLASLADVIGTIVPAHVPEAAGEPGLRLVRPLGPEEEAQLRRRAPARAAAYAILPQAADGAMALREARALGAGAAALRALVAAGVAERMRRPMARGRTVVVAAGDPRPSLTSAQHAAADAIAGAVR